MELKKLLEELRRIGIAGRDLRMARVLFTKLREADVIHAEDLRTGRTHTIHGAKRMQDILAGRGIEFDGTRAVTVCYRSDRVLRYLKRVIRELKRKGRANGDGPGRAGGC